MNVKISDELKADLPQTLRGKVLAATPVVMAVVATMLAGLSSSEMTRAQYDRSLAAQQQSKAGDQWGFFQAKRLRSALQRNTTDLLLSTAEVHPLDATTLQHAVEQLPAEAKSRGDLLTLLTSAAGRAAMAVLTGGALPGNTSPAPLDPRIKAAAEAIDAMRSDADVADLLGRIDQRTLDAALRAARDRAQAFDLAVSPIARTVDRLDALLATEPRLASAASPGSTATYRDFTALRLRFASSRYDAEARLNQDVAALYELQVRQSNLSAERHHLRSQRFFYGMLAAQMAVIISTFAMAARQRNLLWILAAAAGIGAVAFAAYVYLVF